MSRWSFPLQHRHSRQPGEYEVDHVEYDIDKTEYLELKIYHLINKIMIQCIQELNWTRIYPILNKRKLLPIRMTWTHS